MKTYDRDHTNDHDHSLLRSAPRIIAGTMLVMAFSVLAALASVSAVPASASAHEVKHDAERTVMKAKAYAATPEIIAADESVGRDQSASPDTVQDAEKMVLAATAEGACCFGNDAPCQTDLSGNGSTGVSDLLALLGAWGPCADPKACPEDFTGNAQVGVGDLLVLLGAWGACPAGPGCSQVTLSECESLGGFFRGAATDCENCPEPITCPPGAVEEDEPCGDALNDGCNIDPPAFGETLSCGDQVCGTVWAEGGTRDTDWYRISLTQDTLLTWSIEAPFDALVTILGDQCPTVILAGATGPQATVERCLPPGDYIVFVAANSTTGLSCESGLNSYVASASCDSCFAQTGACCTPDGFCSENTQVGCELAEGIYQGNNTVCGNIDCPFEAPPLCKGNCGDLVIDPDIPGGVCFCDEFCEEDGVCCPGVCNDCPELSFCNPASICGQASGNCCQGHGTPGCQDPACCEAVCTANPDCCDGFWSPVCAILAQQICAVCGASPCSPVTCENNEGEPCGDAINDGCNADPVEYATINCGDTICGNLWATATPENPGGARDTDWYLLNITDQPTALEIEWSAIAEAPIQLLILSVDCPATVLHDPFIGCGGSITKCLEPGSYIFFISPADTDGYPCPGFTYEATLTCTSTSECSVPVPSHCEGFCGGEAPEGCFCDDLCLMLGDCCPNFCFDCPDCEGCVPNAPGCGTP